MARKGTPWLILRPEGAKCLRCGAVAPITVPLHVDALLAAIATFQHQHAACEPQQPDKPGRDPREENPR